MIDKKRLLKSLIIISLIIIIIIAIIHIRKTLARYETTATSERDFEVAFWVVDNDFKTDRLVIDDIYPSTNVFDNYTISVTNFDPGNLATEVDDKIAETDIEYEIELITTTNLPLSYEIAKDGETISDRVTQQLFTDSDGTVYRKIKIGTSENPFIMDTINNTTNQKNKITNTFTLKVTFPSQYSTNQEYADLMEDIKINLTARQVIEE